MAAPSRKIAIAAIGRNEGERLERCLRAAVGAAAAVVYVDSGSTDGSAERARAAGCVVVELDPSRPFTAARARNEGFAAALAAAPEAEFVQFLDGDCELEDGWLEKGAEALTARSDLALVCGRLREVNPGASIYNLMCDLEWQRSPGEIRAAGGNFLVRAHAFRAAGGFSADVIAAEDDEFCVRVRRLGWKLWMLDAPMARHDAAMKDFAQWWRRARRTGHAYAQVAGLHAGSEDRYFVPERRRIYIWALAAPAAALLLAPVTRGWSLAALLCAYALQWAHIALGCRRRGWPLRSACLYAVFAVISRFPGLLGLAQYHWRRRRGHLPVIIEHKRSS